MKFLAVITSQLQAQTLMRANRVFSTAHIGLAVAARMLAVLMELLPALTSTPP